MPRDNLIKNPHYRLGRRSIHTEHRRSVQGAMFDPAQLQLAVNMRTHCAGRVKVSTGIWRQQQQQKSRDAHLVWARCSSGIEEKTGYGSLSRSKAALPAQKSFWSRSPLDSACTQSVPDAMCGPWQSPTTQTQMNIQYKASPNQMTAISCVSHLSNDWLEAGTTNSFRHSLHTQFVEV